MPGRFSKSNRPARPGSYTNFQVAQQEQLIPTNALTIAVPITNDWGPDNEVVATNSFEEYLSIFGDSDGAGKLAVRQAFKGEGVNGRGGAGTVLAYRAAASDAAKATVVLNNAVATPVTAITLTAIYKGTRGNSLKATVQTYANDVTKDQLLILDGTTIIEEFSYDPTDLAALVAKINANSGWVTATNALNGQQLGDTSAKPFTGGDDGDTLTSTEWTACTTAFDIPRFSVFAPYDLTDETIVASVTDWCITHNAEGKRFTTIFGGLADEDIDTAIERTEAANDENIIIVGVGTYNDVDADQEISTSQLVPRLAGVLAFRGEKTSITFGRLAGLEIVTGPTRAEILKALDNGVVVIAQDSHPTAPVRIEKALTSYTSEDDDDKPRDIYSNPKFVRTMQSLETELTQYGENNLIGLLPVNQQTREDIIGHANLIMAERQIQSIIQPGWSVGIDNDPPATDEDDFVQVRWEASFGRSLESVYNTIVVQ